MSGPLAFCDRRVVAFRVNRGPYCVDLVKVLAPNVEAFLELLVSRGAVPLSEVDT